MRFFDDDDDDDYPIGPPGRGGANDDIPDPDEDDFYRHERTLPIPRCDENGVPFISPEEQEFDPPDDPVPPFDMFNSFMGPRDQYEADRWVNEPDSSLNGLKKAGVHPRTIRELHFHFLDVYDKHHGF